MACKKLQKHNIEKMLQGEGNGYMGYDKNQNSDDPIIHLNGFA